MSAALLPGSGSYLDGSMQQAFPPSSSHQKQHGADGGAGINIPMALGQGAVSLVGLVAASPAIYVPAGHLNQQDSATTVAQTEEIRTIFVTGFPADVHARELHTLVRFFPGYQASQMSTKSATGALAPQGFALFSNQTTARHAMRRINDLSFDHDQHLRVELAHKNMYLKDDPSIYRADSPSTTPGLSTMSLPSLPSMSPITVTPMPNQAAYNMQGMGSPTMVSAALQSMRPIASGNGIAMPNFVNSHHNSMNGHMGTGLNASFHATNGLASLNAGLTGLNMNGMGAMNGALGMSNMNGGLGGNGGLGMNGGLGLNTALDMNGNFGSMSLNGSSPLMNGLANGNGGLPFGFAPVTNRFDNAPCNTLFIGNLGDGVDENELQSLFCTQPGFQQLKLIRNPRQVSCFVEYMDTQSAAHVHNTLQGVVLLSSDRGPIRVQYSKNPFGRRNNPTNGSGLTHPAVTFLSPAHGVGDALTAADLAGWPASFPTLNTI